MAEKDKKSAHAKATEEKKKEELAELKKQAEFSAESDEIKWYEKGGHYSSEELESTWINSIYDSAGDMTDKINGTALPVARAISSGVNNFVGYYNSAIEEVNDQAAGKSHCSSYPEPKNPWEELNKIQNVDSLVDSLLHCPESCTSEIGAALKQKNVAGVLKILDLLSRKEWSDIGECSIPFLDRFFNVIPLQFYLGKLISNTLGDALTAAIQTFSPDEKQEIIKKSPCGEDMVGPVLKSAFPKSEMFGKIEAGLELPPLPDILAIPEIPEITIPGWKGALKSMFIDLICWEICCLLTPLLTWVSIAIESLEKKAMLETSSWTDGETEEDGESTEPTEKVFGATDLTKVSLNDYIEDEALILFRNEIATTAIGKGFLTVSPESIRNYFTAIHKEPNIKQRHIIYLMLGETDCHTLANLIKLPDTGLSVHLSHESGILKFFTILSKYLNVFTIIEDSKKDICVPDICVVQEKITVEEFIKLNNALCDMLNPEIGMPKLPLSALLEAAGIKDKVPEAIEAQTKAMYREVEQIMFGRLIAEGKSFYDQYLDLMSEPKLSATISQDLRYISEKFVSEAPPALFRTSPLVQDEDKLRSFDGFTYFAGASGTLHGGGWDAPWLNLYEKKGRYEITQHAITPTATGKKNSKTWKKVDWSVYPSWETLEWYKEATEENEEAKKKLYNSLQQDSFDVGFLSISADSTEKDVKYHYNYIQGDHINIARYNGDIFHHVPLQDFLVKFIKKKGSSGKVDAAFTMWGNHLNTMSSAIPENKRARVDAIYFFSGKNWIRCLYAPWYEDKNALPSPLNEDKIKPKEFNISAEGTLDDFKILISSGVKDGKPILKEITLPLANFKSVDMVFRAGYDIHFFSNGAHVPYDIRDLVEKPDITTLTASKCKDSKGNERVCSMSDWGPNDKESIFPLAPIDAETIIAAKKTQPRYVLSEKTKKNITEVQGGEFSKYITVITDEFDGHLEGKTLSDEVEDPEKTTSGAEYFGKLKKAMGINHVYMTALKKKYDKYNKERAEVEKAQAIKDYYKKEESK